MKTRTWDKIGIVSLIVGIIAGIISYMEKDSNGWLSGLMTNIASNGFWVMIIAFGVTIFSFVEGNLKRIKRIVKKVI